MGVSARPPRFVGLRHRAASAADDDHARWSADSRHHPKQQDRIAVRAPARHWRADLSDRRASCAAERCAGRTRVANAAVPYDDAGADAATVENADIWGTTPAELIACRKTIAGLRNRRNVHAAEHQGNTRIPGNVGGPNWSGYAFDTQRQLLIVNTNNLPAIVWLIPRHEFDTMPRRNEGEYGLSVGAPYVLFRRYAQAPSGLPCSKPPWGSLTAVDSRTPR